MAKIWIDMKNPHEPNFFRRMIRFLHEKGHETAITVRGNTEVPRLLSEYYKNFSVIGKHTEKGMMKKLCFFLLRDIQLLVQVPQFDIGLNFISANAVQVARMRRKPVITFTDNDLETYWNKLSFKYANYIITPGFLPKKNLARQGAHIESIIQYTGYKEEIYAADFVPSVNLSSLPDEFVLIRPEAMQAEYINRQSGSIAYDLVEACIGEGLPVVYLPRYKDDQMRTRDISNVYIPSNPLNGLELCWTAKAVLSGSGSLTREAAILGVPAVSFYPGGKLLAVDRAMMDQGRIYHSRNVHDIIKYLQTAKRRSFDRERCIQVRDEVFNIISELLNRIEKDR